MRPKSDKYFKPAESPTEMLATQATPILLINNTTWFLFVFPECVEKLQGIKRCKICQLWKDFDL